MLTCIQSRSLPNPVEKESPNAVSPRNYCVSDLYIFGRAVQVAKLLGLGNRHRGCGTRKLDRCGCGLEDLRLPPQPHTPQLRKH